jgi:hypothetical protein
MKKILAPCLIIVGVCLLTGCLSKEIKFNEPDTNSNKNSLPEVTDTVTPTGTEISYYLSTEDSLKYCDGNNMDSEGYRKTLTKKMIALVPGELTLKEKALKTIELADQAADNTLPYEDSNYIKIIGDTALIEPIGGWAGVSIFLCSWKPFIEVNLLQFPEIKKVLWVNDSQEWSSLTDSQEKTVISYFISYDKETNFCAGGGSEESNIYKETLTQRVIKTIDKKNLTNEELIKQTLQIAGRDTGLSPYLADYQDVLKIQGDTVYFNTIDGFAGLWHEMCLYEPFAEVNLQQFPQIKNIIWTKSQQEWDNKK